jgi:hypothetical protein
MWARSAAPASPQYEERIHERRVTDKVQHCVDLFSFSD